MTERPGDLIARTTKMYREVLGEEPRLVEDFGPALEALLGGVREVIVELPWQERRLGADVERHQIVLRELSEDNSRVVFYNPAARRDVAPGADLGSAEKEGPPRRAEASGLESMEVNALARFFAEGRALALIPPAEF